MREWWIERGRLVAGYVVVIEGDVEGGFGAWCPDLPGCVAVADSYSECVRLMREAVDFHLEGMREDNLPIPEPTAVGSLIVAAG